MGPQEPNNVSRDIARDLTGMAGEIAALKGDAGHWLTGPEYAVLRHRLEDAHGAVEAVRASTKLHKHPTSDNTDRPNRGLARPGAIGAGYYVVLIQDPA